MQLDDYIKTVLVQISKGVSDAALEVKEMNGCVNPVVGIGMGLEGDAGPQNINFDVVVAVAEESKGNGGAKLTVPSVFSVGGSKEGSDSYQQSNRVKFVVPLKLPTGR